MDAHHPVEESYLDEDRTLGQGQREDSRRDLDRPQIRSSNPMPVYGLSTASSRSIKRLRADALHVLENKDQRKTNHSC